MIFPVNPFSRHDLQDKGSLKAVSNVCFLSGGLQRRSSGGPGRLGYYLCRFLRVKRHTPSWQEDPGAVLKVASHSMLVSRTRVRVSVTSATETMAQSSRLSPAHYFCQKCCLPKGKRLPSLCIIFKQGCSFDLVWLRVCNYRYAC